MLRRFSFLARPGWLLLCVASLFAGCTTVEYRKIQTAFELAVRSDNSGSPFGNELERVHAQLTPEYISKLRPELQPNAWMVRSVSGWRLGKFEEARTNSATGLRLPREVLKEGSRDHVVLLMIPALVDDSELGERWLANRRKVPTGGYPAFSRSYQAALNQLRLAEDQFNDRTPPDIQAYCHYAEWRVARNWEGVIGSLDGQEFTAASTDAAAFLKDWLGTTNAITTMKQAQQEIARKLPETDPLRALIRAQSGQ